MKVLRKIVTEGDVLLPSPGGVITEAKDLQVMLDDAITKRLEGVGGWIENR